MVPKEAIFGLIGEELRWKKRYEELERKYKQDIEKLTDDYMTTINTLRSILHKVSEQMPSVAKALDWFLGVRDASISVEGLSRLAAIAKQVEAVSSEPERARGVVERMASALRRVMRGERGE